MTESQLTDILLADQARWQARQDEENAPLAESRAAMDTYECETPILRGIGMVMPPRSYPNRQPRTRVTGDSLEAFAYSLVEVTYADGTSEIREQRDFRANRESRATQSQPRTEVGPHRTMAADLPAVMAD